MSNADIMRVSESLNFNVVDMYTGRTLYLEDGSLNGDSEIEWGVNNWKFNCQSEENRAEQKWSDWSWTGDGYPYIEMYDESDVSIIITCPEDYDGLCLV